jgi:ferredoxin-thioredoxin reductase catalytic subunit
MSVKLNPDKAHVSKIKSALKENQMKYSKPYCPCVIIQNDETVCPCTTFRETQYCCCGLYITETQD